MRIWSWPVRGAIFWTALQGILRLTGAARLAVRFKTPQPHGGESGALLHDLIRALKPEISLNSSFKPSQP
jgi:hypothetical protein